MRIRVIANPVAGGGRGKGVARRVRDRLGTEVHYSTSSEDLEARARAAVADGVERVIAVGGDGTFHQVIRGLAGSECELALVPAGTGNDLPACLGVPLRLADALDLAESGPASPIDLGSVNGTPFAVYCGLGFDSEVAEWITARGPEGKGKLIYVWGALRGLRHFVPPRITVEHDHGVFDGGAMFVTVANCYRFGGGMKIAPGADPADGLLDLVIVGEVSKLEFLRVFPRVFTGSHVSHPKVSTIRTRNVRLRVDRPMTLFGDGEAVSTIGSEGVEVSVRPGALRVSRG